MKTERFALQRVHYMPAKLEAGILYVSEEFGAVAHLCACGCGSKIRTPLGPTEWSVRESAKGPSLWPSVGNWQKACKSHYIITNGNVEWATQWTPEQIIAGRHREEARRKEHYEALYPTGIWQRFWHWLQSLFG
jgi:Family of unknown function (DUF6527)